MEVYKNEQGITVLDFKDTLLLSRKEYGVHFTDKDISIGIHNARIEMFQTENLTFLAKIKMLISVFKTSYRFAFPKGF